MHVGVGQCSRLDIVLPGMEDEFLVLSTSPEELPAQAVVQVAWTKGNAVFRQVDVVSDSMWMSRDSVPTDAHGRIGKLARF